MTITEQIEEIIKPYLCFHENGDISLHDIKVAIDIEDLFLTQNVDYAINVNKCECGPSYEQEYYVFSWIEDSELYTYDILLEWY